MKRFFVMMPLLLALCALPSIACADWSWISPTPQGMAYGDICALSDTFALAVGVGGVIARKDDTGWSQMQSPTDKGLNALCCLSTTSAIAVGENGTALIFDGSTWTEMASPANEELVDVWASSTSDIHVIGSGSGLYSWDGASWSLDVADADLNRVHGLAANNVYAGGQNGALMQYDGSAWTDAGPVNGTRRITDFWIDAGGNVYASGADEGTGQGVVVRYTSALGWKNVTVPDATRLWSIWGSSTNDIYVLDRDTVFHYADGAWTAIPQETIGRYMELSTVRGGAADDVYITGGAAELQHYDGSGWSSENGGVNSSLNAVLGFSNDSLFAVGFDHDDFKAGVETYDGGGWVLTQVGDYPTKFSDITGDSATNMYAVGENLMMTDPIAYSFDGSSWTPLSTTGLSNPLLSACYVPGAGLYAGDDDGYIHLYGASSWTSSQELQSNGKVNSIWSASSTDIWVGLEDGELAHYTGTWDISALPDESYDISSIHGTSSTDVWAVTEGGAIHHYDGSSWSLSTEYSGYSFNAVYAISADDVWVAGDDSAVVHYTNGAWTDMSPFGTDTSLSLNDIWSETGSKVLFFGSNYLILQYDTLSVTLPSIQLLLLTP